MSTRGVNFAKNYIYLPILRDNPERGLARGSRQQGAWIYGGNFISARSKYLPGRARCGII